jgi:hypothetical protein
MAVTLLPQVVDDAHRPALLVVSLGSHRGEEDVDVPLDEGLDLRGEQRAGASVAGSAGVGAAELEELPALAPGDQPRAVVPAL